MTFLILKPYSRLHFGAFVDRSGYFARVVVGLDVGYWLILMMTTK